MSKDSRNITIDLDPAQFGLENLAFEGFTLFGQGKDRLFGTTAGIATLDFLNAIGSVKNTISITGGYGRFRGATGTLLLSENLILNNPDITAPVAGRPTISGTFQTVPEPNQTTALLGIGVIAFALINCQYGFNTKIQK